MIDKDIKDYNNDIEESITQKYNVLSLNKRNISAKGAVEMAVQVQENGRLFTISTANTTYQMKADRYGVLLHLYYGRRCEGSMEYLLTYADRGFAAAIYDAGVDRTYSLDFLPQEFPCDGTGDMRSPALSLEYGNRIHGCDMRFADYKIRNGKYALKGLPAVYADEEEAQTLEILLRDTAGMAEVTLLYGVLPKLDIITRSVLVRNISENEIRIDKIMSANLDQVSGKYDLITFYGRHCMERNFQRTPVAHMEQRIGSRRGTSSHQFNPMMILADRETTETAGSCYSMQFVYSGGFSGCAGMDQYDQTRMQLGLMTERFSYPLAPGETFTAPEVIMSYSSQGLAVLSNNLQECIRKHVCRGKWRDQVRPVLLNSWEAYYMDFDGADILALADEAAELGMDMLVLDDGWFGKRDDDSSGLGDWFVNEEKLGGEMKELIYWVHRRGLKFGIWFEPEMVNEDSDLYRAHPDWAMAIPGRKPVRGRNQLVLDFSRKEVVDYVFESVCKVLDADTVDYVKWDYNRSIADVYSHTASDQGRVLYDYILGLYDFLERLSQRYPDMLIEGCSGGGGRFDAGMLYYTPQIWCSDNTDPIDRLRIQYGTSFGYPASCVGAHVSVSPNEQDGRVTPLAARGITAMSGTFGYELNPEKLSAEEKDEIRAQIAKRKEAAELIHSGRYYRLMSPFDGEAAAWEFVSEDQEDVLLNVVNLEIHGNRPVTYVRLQGLSSGAVYRDEKSGKTYPADALMEAGLPMPAPFGEYGALQIRFKRI